jgi:flavin-dependent dehydrogenase
MTNEVQRETMEYDVVIIGAGPSGLSTSIKIKQLDPNINICILEKSSEVGAHILSGNIFETRALEERKIFIFIEQIIFKLANLVTSKCSEKSQ